MGDAQLERDRLLGQRAYEQLVRVFLDDVPMTKAEIIHRRREALMMHQPLFCFSVGGRLIDVSGDWPK